MRVEYSCIINAPADKVWSVIRVFDKLWDPSYPVKLERDANNRAGDQIGCERTATFPDGAKIHERLEALDDINKRLCYSIISAPFPVKTYVAEYQAFPVTEGNKTFVRWFANFELNKDSGEFNPQEVFSGIFASLLGVAAKMVAE